MTLLIPQTEATDVSRVGGKAASLARLRAEGFAPPEFFVIPADAFRVAKSRPLAKTGLKAELG